MKARTPKNQCNPDYNNVLREYNKSQYDDFFKRTKEMRKSNDPETRAKGKALERSYKLFQNNAVPFVVAQKIYPEMCKIYGDYCFEHAKIIEAAGKTNEQS